MLIAGLFTGQVEVAFGDGKDEGGNSSGCDSGVGSVTGVIAIGLIVETAVVTLS